MTVLFTAPPEATYMAVCINAGNGAAQVVCKDTGKLIPGGDNRGCFRSSAGKCVVKGLDRNTKYTVQVQAHNGIAWSLHSPCTSIGTPDDTTGAVITGVRTREERDAELLKLAIDVEHSPIQTEAGESRITSRLPQAKRVKKEK